MTRREQTARQRFERCKQALGAKCAQRPAGRVLLHLVALCFDHQVAWHVRGVLRELA